MTERTERGRFRREQMNEGLIEGRNALTEALRAGRTIDKLYVASGDIDRTLSRLVAEAKQALAEGCEELDMVINIGKLKHGDADYVENEIRQLAETAHAAGAILKVILETCYLTEEEKILACKLSTKAGADFVKTSTGYGSAGCTIEDLKLMRANTPETMRIKGSGGIRDLDTVLSARAVGASRCGVSATEKIMAEAEKRYAEGTLKEIDTLKEMGGGY